MLFHLIAGIHHLDVIHHLEVVQHRCSTVSTIMYMVQTKHTKCFADRKSIIVRKIIVMIIVMIFLTIMTGQADNGFYHLVLRGAIM